MKDAVQVPAPLADEADEKAPLASVVTAEIVASPPPVGRNTRVTSASATPWSVPFRTTRPVALPSATVRVRVEGWAGAGASALAPFDYASMIWALALGYFVFGDEPLQIVLAGACVVILAGLFVIWREHQLGLVRRAEERITKPRVA